MGGAVQPGGPVIVASWNKAVTATFGTLNAFSGIITGFLPTEGY